MKLFFLSFFLLGSSLCYGEVNLEKSFYEVLIPEAQGEIDPSKMNPVDLNSFNENLMPQIVDLKFYSYKNRSWNPILWNQINNYCFARRTAIDTFLWFQEPLKAVRTGVRDPSVLVQEGKYFPPGFRYPNYKTHAWIEAARIQIVGKLKTGNVEWNNHEAVVINTDKGVRVLDPSFSHEAMEVEEFLSYFAPSESGGVCYKVDDATLKEINWQLVSTQQFKSPWDEKIPFCGFNFKQRLNAGDTISGTGSYQGSEEEKFLSVKFFKYFEEDLLKKY